MTDEADTKFASFFLSLPSTPNTLRFFQRKEKNVYTCHGEDAVFVAMNYYKTTSVVKHGAKGLKLVSMNRNLYESVVRDVLVETGGKTVEVYEQTGSTNAPWRLAKTASPGNIGALEEEVFRSSAMAETPVVMAACTIEKDGQKMVGVAFCDSGKRCLYACEVIDDEQLCTLESIVVQVGARECVVPEATASASSSSSSSTAAAGSEYKKLVDVMTRCGVLVSERPKKSFDTKNLESDLTRLLASGNIERHRDVLDLREASRALAAILSFAELTADVESLRKWQLALHVTGRFMRLDAAAMRALHVMPMRGDASASFSIYGLLCRAKTPMGKRLLRTWLKQPLLDIEAIATRHRVVSVMTTDSVLREALRSRIRGMPDIERLSRKLDRGRIDLRALCQLYRASGLLSIVSNALRNCDSVVGNTNASDEEGQAGGYRGEGAAPTAAAELIITRFCEPLERAHDAEHLGKFEALIEAAVDLDKVPEDFLISASYSDELGELEEQRADVLQEIEDEADSVSSDLGLVYGKNVKLERNNALGHYLRITKKEEAALRQRMQGKYYQLEAKKDGVKFLSNKLKRLSDSYASLTTQYAKVQADLVAKVVSVAQGYTEVFDSVSGIIAELDVLLGFSEVAVDAPMPFVRPTMLPMGEGDIVLEQSRHPCVEAQDGVSFIPNDCIMKRDSSWFQTITGPNMGGKSTFIRQVGICVLMAQVGSFVPCSCASISIRDAIFARVGAGDCQIRGVSTFMAEMLETAAILRSATSSSLIIVDELGRGTSTYDGFGLAWAISEHICREIRAPCLFATHFHELTALGSSEGCSSAENFHVTTAIDPRTKRLTMLYRVAPGACDQSFGIHVAEFANFPAEVVRMAREKAAELEDFSAAVPLHNATDDGVGAPVGGDEGDDDEGALALGKRKRIEAASSDEGAARAKAFLDEFAKLPMDSMSKEEALSKTRAMLRDLQEETKDMPLFQSLFSAAA